MSPPVVSPLPVRWYVLVIVIVSLAHLCKGNGNIGSANSSVSHCTPRKVSEAELVAWTELHKNAVLPANTSRQSWSHRIAGQRSRRRRRDLLVSDTQCSLENLCQPTERPRVCYLNTDICDGERDCSSGRDELYCDECLCPYQMISGVTMVVPNSPQRFWTGVNLQGCARACNDVDAGCVAFSFNVLRTDQERCRIFFRSGRLVAAQGGDLYMRDSPSTPRLAPPTENSAVQSAPLTVGSKTCADRDMYKCPDGQGCLPYEQVCDGIRQCSSANEEQFCRIYPSFYSRVRGRTISSYSSPFQDASLATCAAYCSYHTGGHPKCRFFAYRSAQRECLIGCSSCGDDALTILEDASADYYALSPSGVVAWAGVFLKYGSSISPNDPDLAAFRPAFSKASESLKTLGITVPSRPVTIDLSSVAPTRTSVPVAATVQPFGKPSAVPSGNTANGPAVSLSGAGVAPPAPPAVTASSSPPRTEPGAVVAGATPALLQLPTDCGRRPLAALAASDVQTRVLVSDRTSNRVVAGHRASYGTYPWQAQVQVYSDAGHWEHHCGGALIGERLVLTAAHCLTRALGRMQVKLGQHDRRDAGEQYEQTFAVENALSHPGYRSDPVSGDANDLAVLKLRLRQGRPVLFSSHVQPLCLPSGAAPPPVGQPCEISGWGKTDPLLPNVASSAADVLHGGSVPIVSDSFCAAAEVYGARFVADKMICAGHLRGGTDACQGDSGGPLACRVADGLWQLTGIVSFGEGCGGQLKPGVYTRVSHYVPWIQRVVQLL